MTFFHTATGSAPGSTAWDQRAAESVEVGANMGIDSESLMARGLPFHGCRVRRRFGRLSVLL